MSEAITERETEVHRRPNGQFLPGYRGGPGGNQLAGKMQKLKAVLVSVVTPEEMEKVARTLLRLALEGDVLAIKLLFERLFGKPDQGIQVSGEIGIRKYQHINWEQLAAIAAACAIQEAERSTETSRVGASSED